MTVFDIIILAIIAAAAIGGLFRGLVEQLLSLAALSAAVMLVGLLHEPATQYLATLTTTETGASLLAYIGLFGIGYFVLRWIASAVGQRSRESALGPIDRVLGFGFGVIKGVLLCTTVFLLIILVHEYAYATRERPQWLTEGRTYPLLNACGDLIVEYLEERRAGTG
ncbi:MAG: CvpA family protein [Pseudomonadota bacterium]